jgi:hypothetical protein
MKLAFSTDNNKLAPLLPGVTLLLVKSGSINLFWQQVKTIGWQPILWGKQLMYYDVDMLFCAGIDQFIYGAIRGFGIYVVPNCTGTSEEVFKKWQSGSIKTPEL